MPFLAGWEKRKEVRYGATKPASNLTDFPKLLIVSADADMTAELSGGGGITVTGTDGTTEVPFGLYPGHSLATGTFILRAKFSPLSGASTGDVMGYIYYDSTQSTTEDKAGTVSNGYVRFMPLEEDPSGSQPTMYDWVAEANNGNTATGTMTSGDLIACKVGNGLDMDSNDDISLGTGLLSSNVATAEVWAWNTANSGYLCAFSARSSDSDAFELFAHGEGGNGKIGWGNYSSQCIASGFATSTWQHIAITSDGSTTRAYINGTVGGTTGTNNWANYASQGYYVGSRAGGLNWVGRLDEFRLSSVARSAAWLAYTFADDDDNTDTTSLGAEETDTPAGGHPAAKRMGGVRFGPGFAQHVSGVKGW